MKSAIAPVVMLCIALASGSAHANPVLFTWTGSSSSGGATHPLAGWASFDTVSDASGGYDLVVTLANTAQESIAGTDWILGGLYFNILQGTNSGIGGTPPGALTPLSATAYELASVAQTSKNGPFTVTYGSPGASVCANAHPGFYGCTTNTVSGGWEAAYSSAGLSGGQHWALGTARQGIFKGNNTGGMNFGIIPLGGIDADYWSADSSPYVYQYATFTMRGLSNSAIFVTQVAATYGTGPSTVINGILVSGEAPEPNALIISAAGILLLAALGRRRRRPRGR